MNVKELIEKYEDAIVECSDQIQIKEAERFKKPFWHDVITTEIRRNNLEVGIYKRFITELKQLEK